MAISYSDLFTKSGRLIAWMNAFRTIQGTNLLGTNGAADDVLDEFADRRDLVKGLQGDVEGFATTVASWVGTYKGYLDALLSDLQKDLNSPSSDPATILPLLVTDMVANSESVTACVVAAATPTADGSNVGNGKVYTSKKNVDGIDDQRIVNETVDLVCIADQYAGGADSGGESFSVTGWPSRDPNLNDPTTTHTPGNGNGPTLTVADASNLLSNGDFEAFDGDEADVPDDWTRDAGTATTNINNEASSFHRGASALKLLGDGSTGTITLSQNISDAVEAKTIYALGVWLRKSGTVSAGSTFKVRVTGTGFSTVNAYSADPNGLTTSYAHSVVFFPTGATIPTDLKVEITWTTAATAGATAVILVDDVVLTEATDFGHVQLAAFAGATDFAKPDAFSYATTNDEAGVFQRAFGRWYDTALPTSGSPTRSDSLAT